MSSNPRPTHRESDSEPSQGFRDQLRKPNPRPTHRESDSEPSQGFRDPSYNPIRDTKRRPVHKKLYALFQLHPVSGGVSAELARREPRYPDPRPDLHSSTSPERSRAEYKISETSEPDAGVLNEHNIEDQCSDSDRPTYNPSPIYLEGNNLASELDISVIELTRVKKALQQREQLYNDLKHQHEDMREKAAVEALSHQKKVSRLESERDNLRKRVIAMESFCKIEGGVTFGDYEKMGELKTQNDSLEKMVENLNSDLDQMKTAMSEMRDDHAAVLSKMNSEHDAVTSKMAAQHLEDTKKIRDLQSRLIKSMNSRVATIDQERQTVKDIGAETREIINKIAAQHVMKMDVRKANLLQEAEEMEYEFAKITRG
jgi:hypothetical protein